MQVAIDGPAGAGKSSVARRVAKILGATYLDTGAMYRSLTLKALDLGTDLQAEAEMEALARNTSIEILPGDENGNRIVMDGRDVTDLIRSPKVNSNVSIVACSPGVRKQMVALQRESAYKSDNVVLDGRDIGTNVLPDAGCKIFLTASLQERAKRRRMELEEKGLVLTQHEVEQQIAARDKIDSTRAVNPLTKPKDAVTIDTTLMTLPEVVETVINYISNKKSPKEINVKAD